MEIETKDYTYQEYVCLYKKARRENFKLIIHGVCKECGNVFTKMHTDEEGYCLCSKCKTKKNQIKKYGSIENMQKHKMEKTRETNLKKYGCECSFQNESVKSKIKKTLTERYGNGALIENVSQIEEVKDKIKQTNLERYGTEYYLSSDDCKEKIKKTSLEKYGVESPNSSSIVKQHKVESYLNHYGETNPNKCQEVRDRVVKTCLDRYGRVWNTYKYYYDGYRFDSSWEVKLYIFLKDHNYNFTFHPKDMIKEYYVNGEKHHYEPDFLIEGQLYEVKGTHFFNEEGQLINIYGDKSVLIEKQNAMKDVNILTEDSEFLKEAFKYFDTLKIDIKDFRRNNDNNSSINN